MSAQIPENDIDKEFGQHECSICGTDCSYVSDMLDQNAERIAALEAQNRHQQGLLSGRDHTLIQTLEKEASQLREHNRQLREALKNYKTVRDGFGNYSADAALDATDPKEEA